jgi:hypothetical protein
MDAPGRGCKSRPVRGWGPGLVPFPIDHLGGCSHDTLPLLKGEGWGEVSGLSGEVTHLTLSLSFQERGHVLNSFA